jgi:hypothetical protein
LEAFWITVDRDVWLESGHERKNNGEYDDGDDDDEEEPAEAPSAPARWVVEAEKLICNRVLRLSVSIRGLFARSTRRYGDSKGCHRRQRTTGAQQVTPPLVPLSAEKRMTTKCCLEFPEAHKLGKWEKHVVVIGAKRRRFMYGAYLEMQANRHRQAIPGIKMVKRMCHAYRDAFQ